jgi:hypothetical protein
VVHGAAPPIDAASVSAASPPHGTGSVADTFGSTLSQPGGGIPGSVDPNALMGHALGGAGGAAAQASPTGTGDAVVQVLTDPRLLTVTGVSALAGAAFLTIHRGTSCVGGTPSVVLTNVRLIPCLVKNRLLEGGTLANARATAGSAAGYAVRGFSTGSSTVRSRVSSGATAARDGMFANLIGPLREGFGRVVQEGPDAGPADGASDSRLMVQIGMVLGLVYVALVCIWFWLTRLRWNLR